MSLFLAYVKIRFSHVVARIFFQEYAKHVQDEEKKKYEKHLERKKNRKLKKEREEIERTQQQRSEEARLAVPPSSGGII